MFCARLSNLNVIVRVQAELPSAPVLVEVTSAGGV